MKPLEHRTESVETILAIWLNDELQGQVALHGNLTSTTLPAMPSVAAAAGYWDRLDDDVVAALNYAVEHAFVDNYSGTGYDTFNQAVVSVMDDGADIQVALTDAQAAVEIAIEGYPG